MLQMDDVDAAEKCPTKRRIRVCFLNGLQLLDTG